MKIIRTHIQAFRQRITEFATKLLLLLANYLAFSKPS